MPPEDSSDLAATLESTATALRNGSIQRQGRDWRGDASTKMFNSKMAKTLACFEIVPQAIYHKEPRNISWLSLVANVIYSKFPTGADRLQRVARLCRP